jgi:DNA-binding response OmpR family regulator
VPRILLIDDDPSLLDVLAMAFEDAGHTVLLADGGLIGHAMVLEQRPDLIVSDVNMPGLDGFSLCRRLRDAGDDTPLLLLTSRDSEIDEALGFELGADDYVAKPFSTRVLLARVAALLRRQAVRRAEPVAGPVGAREVGALGIDPDRIELTWKGRAVRVTVTEFRLVEALTARTGVVFSRPQLLRAMRDDDSVVVERIIDTYIRRLRRRFEEVDDTFDRIETVIGAGYRWRDG